MNTKESFYLPISLANTVAGLERFSSDRHRELNTQYPIVVVYMESRDRAAAKFDSLEDAADFFINDLKITKKEFRLMKKIKVRAFKALVESINRKKKQSLIASFAE